MKKLPRIWFEVQEVLFPFYDKGLIDRLKISPALRKRKFKAIIIT